MTTVPIMIPYNTNGSCDVPMALFDKVSLTLIAVLIIAAFILIIIDTNSFKEDLYNWIMGCFGVSALIGFVWLIHAIWF